jgi:hypothetical protein
MDADEVKKTNKDWLSGQAVDFYDVGIEKLITRYGYLNLHGNYVTS